MKYVVPFLIFLVFLSGCIEKTKKDSYFAEHVIIDTEEYRQEKSQYGDSIFIYSTFLSKENASELKENISEIVPVDSTLVVFGNKEFYDKGYVYQVANNGTILARTSLDSYRARSQYGVVIDKHHYNNKSCEGASLSLDNISYDGSKLSAIIKNSGKIDFESVKLVIISGKGYEIETYETKISSNETYEIVYMKEKIDTIQIYPSNCPDIKLKKTL